MPSPFIDDGYTMRVAIAGRSDYDRIEFECRIPVNEVVDDYLRYAIYGVPDNKKARRGAEWMAKNLTSWDIKDRSGEPVEITVDNALRLHSHAFGRILGVMTGTEAPDEILDDTMADAEDSEKN